MLPPFAAERGSFRTQAGGFMENRHARWSQLALLGLVACGVLSLTGAAANAKPVRTASGSHGGIIWQARSVIVGTASTATLAGGGNPIYLPAMPQYAGTVALIMDYGADGVFICSGTLLPDRRSVLTAAHCVSDGTAARPLSTTAWFYGGSDPDTIVPNNAVSTAIAVSDYFVHSGYSGDVIDQNDIAVLRLQAEAPAFATSYDLYDGGADGTLTGEDMNLAGYGRRSDSGGAVGANLDTGRLRQGDNRYEFRFGDPDFGGSFVDPGFFGPMAEYSYVVDFDSGQAANDASCRIAAQFGLGGSKYCNPGRGTRESVIAGGDSGGPNFVGGSISGVNSYILSFGSEYGDVDDTLNNTFGEFGGFVPVYRHQDFIRDHMVPPGPGLLAGMSLKSSVISGCRTVTGTVTLSGPAPAEGVVVTLGDTLASATVPATLKILAGATTKTFTVKTLAVATEEPGTVSAALGGTTLHQPLTVRPMGMYSVSLSPTSVVGGKPVAGTARLECKAGPGAVTVHLASTDPSVAKAVAASISVPQGLQTATFDVITNPVSAKSYVTLSGTANGISKSKRLTVTPAASVSPTSLKFGYVVVNTTSPVLSATLYNNGTSAFSVASISVTGTSARYFAQTHDCPATLAVGANCTVGVTFSPTVTGGKSAKLSIATSATAAPLSVSLSGTGVTAP
jgi:secreted trypsin-like serine protease